MSGITKTPEIFGDKPHLEGHRIAVHQIWVAVKRDDHEPEEVVEELYPQLTIEEVNNALAFAKENKIEELIGAIEDEERKLREIERSDKEELESRYYKGSGRERGGFE